MIHRPSDRSLWQGLQLIGGGSLLAVVALAALWLSGTSALQQAIGGGTWMLIIIAAVLGIGALYLMLGGTLLIVRTERS